MLIQMNLHNLSTPLSAQGTLEDEGSGRAWDLFLLLISITILALYHIWYYSWRFSNLIEARGYHRVDLTGQRAREIFVRSIVTVASDNGGNADAATNIALQAARNPITAVSILATGTTVGATTLVGILLDSEKMNQVRALGENDPLTGSSTLFSPEAKLACAVGMLFLSFFSLAQSLRLFIHFSFFIRAARFCADNPDYYGEDTTEGMFADSCKSCLRAQTFMSLGFRFLYCWIPLIFWLLGGTFLFSATVLTTIALYNLDQI
jgi:uncharacterized membrane protein